MNVDNYIMLTLEVDKDGEIIIPAGAGMLQLPTLTAQIARKLFSYAVDDPRWIGRLARRFSPQDKIDLKSFCSRDDDLYREYCFHATRWAAVLNFDNHWDISSFHVVYSATVSTGWAEKVIVTDKNVRFVVCTNGDILTFHEFELVYSIDIVAHLTKVKNEHSAHIERVINAITSRTVKRKVSVSTVNGVITDDFVGMEGCHPRDWQYPPGVEFLACEYP